MMTNWDGTIPTLPINFEEYNPQDIVVWEEYTDIDNEYEDLERALLAGTFPYLIESEKGQGKTLLVHTLCKKHNIALVTQPLGSGTTDRDLIGRKEINKNGTAFNLGLLPKGIEVANQFGHACIYGDEANAQDHDVQKVWNSICDGRKYIVANGKTYKLKEGCKLTVIWTVNPVSYAGVNTLTEDVRSRFIGRVWDYPNEEQFKKLLKTDEMKEENKFIIDPLLRLAHDIHALRSKGQLEYTISTRDIMQFMTYLKELNGETEIVKSNLAKALRNVFLIKYNDDKERELVKVRINDTFGVML